MIRSLRSCTSIVQAQAWGCKSEQVIPANRSESCHFLIEVDQWPSIWFLGTDGKLLSQYSTWVRKTRLAKQKNHPSGECSTLLRDVASTWKKLRFSVGILYLQELNNPSIYIDYDLKIITSVADHTQKLSRRPWRREYGWCSKHMVGWEREREMLKAQLL
jgi:hypothetical protein